MTKRFIFFFTILLLILSSCGKIKHKTKSVLIETKNKIIDKIEEPSISSCSLLDKFPLLKNQFDITFEQGIKLDYIPNFYKYYFTYSGDENKILKFISQIKCSYTEIKPDSICHKITLNEVRNEFNRLNAFEKQKTDFFYKFLKSDTTNLEVYECVKTPEQHLIIIDKKSGIIYHKIENFRE